ncbi:putative N-acetyltransferase YhbS [Novosphingobium hassiacum]|uniref:Putative N-acetyltransferase YhbS n=1 Tax=Novosphingobium hassiacum TaxID=173676 RepID=A0A7W5ZW98_9SPHN|nr:GNAT family N-acetyltransferase [Novosphingobium hassiacum]MBB3859634.1 putative N-acetyltransferase YhbS [Novosphingobium hassiacum]
MAEDLIVRPLEKRDLPAALAIQSAAYPSFLVESADAFASRLDVPAQFCLAAVSNGELVAYLLAHGWLRQSPPPIGAILSPAASSEVLFIHDLAVGLNGRGLALGRRLVNRAFELAAKQKLARAELIAVEGAAAYWRSLGFAEVDVAAELKAKVAVYGQNARWMTREFAALSSS